MNEGEVIDSGVAEGYAWYPDGKQVDGSPYTADPQIKPFFDKMVSQYGGIEEIKRLTREDGRDPNCGNHQLYTIFKLLGIARE